MLHNNLGVGAYSDELRDDPFEDICMLYDPDQFSSFFPEGGDSLRGRESENGSYLACWREHESSSRSASYPPGICLAKNQEVVLTAELANVSAAVPANDGTVAVVVNAGDDFLVFDAEGEKLLEDSFESNVSAIAIAPDGDHVALSTAFPDNAVHIYETRNGHYLGRTENRTTNVLGHLRFVTQDGKQVVETYNVAPDSDLDVHENRKQVIDRIPVAPQMDVSSLDGICILADESEGSFHHIPAEEVSEVEGALRIPGVDFKSSCGRSIKPITATVLFSDPKEAIESRFEFCSDCKNRVASYPEKKSEKTHPS